MPPTLLTKLAHAILPRSNSTDIGAVRSQWQDPNDILTILTLIGGDIVQRAIAQSAGVYGHIRFTPVAFSFGWVAYSFSAIMAALGDHRLTPNPDCECKLFNVKSQQARDNKSWVLGRLVRDWERRPRPSAAKTTEAPTLGQPSTSPLGRIRRFIGQTFTKIDQHLNTPKGSLGGLTVAFYRVKKGSHFGVAEWDWVFYLSTFIIILQLGIACIPGAIHGNWVVLILTVGGTALAQLGCALPQWREEKWSARPSGKRSVVCLTRGNGSNYAMVVISDDNIGLRFEDLAGGREVPTRLTTYATFILAVLWVVHLITTQGLSQDSWFSLAVGALGMTQNLIAAGARRVPAALGLPLEHIDDVYNKKVFLALQEADDCEFGVGLALVDEFFPGGLRMDEERWREECKERLRSQLEQEKGRAKEQERNKQTAA